MPGPSAFNRRFNTMATKKKVRPAKPQGKGIVPPLPAKKRRLPPPPFGGAK